MEYEGGSMTFWERFQDAVNSFFGHMDEPAPAWSVVALILLLTALSVLIIMHGLKKEDREDENELEEIQTPDPVSIRRQPAEVFETDCDLCGCGYRYTVDYVKDFTTVCPHCGTKNPHGPADTDIISRRDE